MTDPTETQLLQLYEAKESGTYYDKIQKVVVNRTPDKYGLEKVILTIEGRTRVRGKSMRLRHR